MLGACQERAGFLFAHDCPRPAIQRCAQCDKPICAEHGHPWNGQQACTECFKATRREEAQSSKFRRAPAGADDDPYLYSSYYYRGYGYYGHGHWGHELFNDPNDFTEADGQALRQRAREQREFEEDMGGS
ncbi:hypothetical protein Q664_51685 [Archangium violaceum Cb vi76]|uniref:Uncharacterized protein n=2 Tax=Archangium violaceum TaxID=83451 RepID=A0A084SEH1_9BACT|nr:hypothetical protein Q664_51685 [Archangium violaceum Cb vi76]